MNNSTTRTLGLSALATALLLSVSACATPATRNASADRPAPALTAEAVDGIRADAPALVVSAAQPGPQQTAVVTPSPTGPAPTGTARNVKLASYDPATGTAVLAAADTIAPAGGGTPAPGASATGASASKAAPAPGKSAGPSASAAPSTAGTPSAASSSAASQAPQEVRAGQLIASPPTAAAPQGALLAVTAVQPKGDGTVTASTRPATLPELLGGAEADGKVAVDPHAVSVKPLVKDVKVSFAADLGGVNADAAGTLQLDVQAPIPLPGGANAQASGSVSMRPAVHFAYHGARVGAPRTASVGFDLGAHAQWKVNGELSKGTGKPLRVPLAELHADPVLNVGGLPVVVNLGLTAYLEISADGTVSVEVEQEFDGGWNVKADYAGDRGWSPLTKEGDTKVSPVRAKLSGKADVKAALGAEVSVGLYGAVGVEAVVKPYLLARAEGAVALDSKNGVTQANGTLGLYGGVDLTGALTAHLKIFGTPVIEGRVPLPVLHREWPIKTFSKTG
ncbi:hypothetical protein [Kitasatospora camelliae]|uniref:Lipoprotein n=1 Tax=Kitasatospora camelliae TaxID=3156397 RepID=A0AAU8JWN3_9ACTN